MAHQHDSSNIGKDIITTPSNGYDIGIKNVDYQERIVLRSLIYRYCLLIRSVSLVPLTAEFVRDERVLREFLRSGLPLMESRGDIIYFILEAALLRRSATNALADVDLLPRHHRFRMHFSRCAAGGGVKSISRSRHDKKRICIPTICNPSAGCRKIDGTDSYLPLVNNTVGESA